MLAVTVGAGNTSFNCTLVSLTVNLIPKDSNHLVRQSEKLALNLELSHLSAVYVIIKPLFNSVNDCPR